MWNAFSIFINPSYIYHIAFNSPGGIYIWFTAVRASLPCSLPFAQVGVEVV